jgi:hypothetical protein
MTALPDIVCFSHLRWNFVFQRPQHLMTRWARAHRVFFFEEPVYGPEDEGLVITTDCSGVRVVTPHLTSRTPDEAATIRGLLEALMVDHRIEHFISWYYTPMALSFTSALRPKAVVYDCMDELSLFRGAPPELQERERELMRRASLVFTGGHRLFSARRAATIPQIRRTFRTRAWASSA